MLLLGIKPLTNKVLQGQYASHNYKRGGMSMKGSIGTKQKCPKCRGKFEKIADVGLLCRHCLTTPTRLYIRIYWAGKTEYIGRDKWGQSLDSNERARRLLEHIRYEVDHHIFDPVNYVRKRLEPYFFRNYALDRLKHYESRTDRGDLSPGTLKNKRGYINNYFIPFFKLMDIREIRGHHVEKFKESLPSSLSDKTRSNILNELHKLLSDAYQPLQLIREIPYFDHIGFQKPEISFTTPEKRDLIISHIPERDQPIFRFMAYCGGRPGEARALKRDCVDLDNGFVVIKRTFSGPNLREKTKNKRAKVIHLEPEMLALIKAQPKSFTGFVFTNRFGRPYGKLYDVWGRACKKAGVKIKLYNAVRHTFATSKLHEGHSLETIGKILGHSKSEMTERYAAVLDRDVKAALRGPKVVNLEEAKDTGGKEIVEQ